MDIANLPFHLPIRCSPLVPLNLPVRSRSISESALTSYLYLLLDSNAVGYDADVIKG